MRRQRLDDDLLNVSVPPVQCGDGFQRPPPVMPRFPDADEQSGRKGDARPPGRRDGRQPPLRMFVGRASVGGLFQQRRTRRLQHHPHRSAHRTQAAQLVLGLVADVDVRRQTPLQRQPTNRRQVVVIITESPPAERFPNPWERRDAFAAHNERLAAAGPRAPRKTGFGFGERGERRRSCEGAVAAGERAGVGGNERDAVRIRHHRRRTPVAGRDGAALFSVRGLALEADAFHHDTLRVC